MLKNFIFRKEFIEKLTVKIFRIRIAIDIRICKVRISYLEAVCLQSSS